jgi:hypothetical protein
MDNDAHSLQFDSEYKKCGRRGPCSKMAISLQGFVIDPADNEMRRKVRMGEKPIPAQDGNEAET